MESRERERERKRIHYVFLRHPSWSPRIFIALAPTKNMFYLYFIFLSCVPPFPVLVTTTRKSDSPDSHRVTTGYQRGGRKGILFSPFFSSPLNFNLRFHIPSPPILPRISVNIYCRERYSRKSSSREFAVLNDPDHSMELKRQPPLFCSINWTVALQCLTPSVHTWLLLRRLFTIVAPCCWRDQKTGRQIGKFVLN